MEHTDDSPFNTHILMAQKALLIGSQTGGLTGVHNDVSRIKQFLTQRGFDSAVHIRENATREGIIEGFNRLIKDSNSSDSIFIYYSGHGHRSKSAFSIESIDDPRPRYHQYIIPYDFKRSAMDEFNGVLNIELSALLGKLTETTKNVTVVLDCCHAALMARDGSSLTPKKDPKAKEKSHEIFLEFYKQNDIDLNKAAVVSNPNTVRLVAASKNQSAYEYTNDNNVRGGLLTDSLLNIMEELKGRPVSLALFSRSYSRTGTKCCPHATSRS